MKLSYYQPTESVDIHNKAMPTRQDNSELALRLNRRMKYIKVESAYHGHSARYTLVKEQLHGRNNNQKIYIIYLRSA